MCTLLCLVTGCSFKRPVKYDCGSYAGNLHVCRYSARWQQHVLAHVPFYLALFPAVMELIVAVAGISADQAYRLIRTVATVCSAVDHLGTGKECVL